MYTYTVTLGWGQHDPRIRINNYSLAYLSKRAYMADRKLPNLSAIAQAQLFYISIYLPRYLH